MKNLIKIIVVWVLFGSITYVLFSVAQNKWVTSDWPEGGQVFFIIACMIEWVASMIYVKESWSR